VEFFPCRNPNIGNLFDPIDLKTGYVNTILSDLKTRALCKLAIDEWICQALKFRECTLCDRGNMDLKYISARLTAWDQAPRIMMIQGFEPDSFSNIEWKQKLLCFSQMLEVGIGDYFISSAVKCEDYDEYKSSNNAYNYIDRLLQRFDHCGGKLEQEVELLKPTLIIGYHKMVYHLLKSRFSLPVLKFNFLEIYSIEIGSRSLPIFFIKPYMLDRPEKFGEEISRLKPIVREILSNQTRTMPEPQVINL
jgi:hypothetical protein